MVNPEHETGFGDINGDLPEADFWTMPLMVSYRPP